LVGEPSNLRFDGCLRIAAGRIAACESRSVNPGLRIPVYGAQVRERLN
jgi:hypothetical protein